MSAYCAEYGCPPEDMEGEEWNQVDDTWLHFVYRVEENLITALAGYHDLSSDPHDDDLLYQAVEEVIAGLSEERKLSILVAAVAPIVERDWQDIVTEFQVRRADLDECGIPF